MVCSQSVGQLGSPDLEERSILLSVIILLPCMFPRNPKDCLFVVFPNQSDITPAVDLVDQPLSQFAVATADGQAVVLIQVHLCKIK